MNKYPVLSQTCLPSLATLFVSGHPCPPSAGFPFPAGRPKPTGELGGKKGAPGAPEPCRGGLDVSHARGRPGAQEAAAGTGERDLTHRAKDGLSWRQGIQPVFWKLSGIMRRLNTHRDERSLFLC